MRRRSRLSTSGGHPAEKIRVLFVHTATLPPLGADTWVQCQIIAGLDRDLHEVHLACAKGSPAEPTPTFGAMRAIPDLHVVAVNFGPEFSHRSTGGKIRALIATLPAVVSFANLVRYIRRNDIQIIHTTDRPRDSLATILLARLTGTRSIVHAHVAYNAEWMSAMLRWSMKRADGLIAISEFVASTLIASGHDESKVHVVLNSIDLAAWQPRLGREDRRAEFGFSPDDTVIITVCRLFPAKGAAELIQALALVRTDCPDVRLLIVGQETNAGYVAELAALAAELGVDRHVVFTGRRSDIGALMAAADIYAMPSFLEPFGLVYLEAMAMELPIVALNNGGTPEVVDHGGSGLLSSHGDLTGFADNLLTLVRDPPRRSLMGRRGRRRVEAKFTIERMARDTGSVYRLLAAVRADTAESNGGHA